MVHVNPGDPYPVGARLTLVTRSGAEYPVEVTGLTALPDDLVVRWLGLRPLSAVNAELSTICLNDLREVRFDAWPDLPPAGTR